MLVLDTHIWIWLAAGSDQVSTKLLDQISADPSNVFVSPISTWETHLLVEKGRIKFTGSPSDFVRELISSSPFRLAPLNHEIAVLSRTLEFKHDDPADRFIAATASHLDATLATNDRRLLDLNWLDCVS